MGDGALEGANPANSSYSGGVDDERSPLTAAGPLLVVRCPGSDRSVRPGASYLIGRDPACDFVLADSRVSWQHAVLRLENGTWVLTDNGSMNGTYHETRRVGRLEISGECLVRLGNPVDGLVLSCTVEEAIPARERREVRPPPAEADGQRVTPAALADGDEEGDGDGTLEIPYAIRWLVPKGERFANFDILNDNDTQLDYYRKFGHIYAVGVPAKKWRLVVVSDPELLDEVAADEEQFGKRVEEINFFAQLSNSRGGGISVIGDGEHYEQIRRVMLPWYAPSHQRTQLPRMQEQARKLVAAWSAIPDDQPLDARGWMERYTLEVSGRGACNYDFGLLDGDGDGDGSGQPHPFAAAVPESTKESILRVAEPRPDFTVFAGPARRARRKRYRNHNRELFRTAEALVRGRMHTCPAGQQTDLLGRLLSTPDPETGQFLDVPTMRDQILMHLSNGFNGPSITGAWLAYILATHPDVEERVVAEIDEITGGDPDYDLQYDDLLSMTYITQVIKETMRVYPPMPVTIRRSLKDGMLGRYRVRKDDIILVGTLAAQRDPRYWGPNPDAFDPEQFAPEKVIERPRHAFIPFSIGKRQCMAQEVTFMMLRVVLCVIYTRYRLRLAPGVTVSKNTIVTTKPAAVPVVRLPRELVMRPRARAVARDQPRSLKTAAAPDWGAPTEIPATSAYRHLVIAYGSNFGANKELAERFAERASFQGYTTEVLTLNELAAAPPRTEPWLLAVLTSTYTSNPPSNAAAFKVWIERAEPGEKLWRNCTYLVWGLGNSQWNAFLAFPRLVHKKLADLGARPQADFAYADVGSPVWERTFQDWNARVWPGLLQLSGARPTAAAAARFAADKASAGALTGTDSATAMHRSLLAPQIALGPAGPAGQAEPASRTRAIGASSVMRAMSAGPADTGSTQPRSFLVPTILTNAVGLATMEARVLAARDLQHVELTEADPASGGQPAARSLLQGGRSSWHLPQERRGPGRAARSLPGRCARRPFYRAEDSKCAGRTERCRAGCPQRAHQPCRHQRPASTGVARLDAGEGDRPFGVVAAGRDQGSAANAGWPGFAAARGNRRRRLRRRQAARGVQVLLAEHLRVPAGSATAPAALLLDKLEPADPRRQRRPRDRRTPGSVRAWQARARLRRPELALCARGPRGRPRECLP